MCQERIQGISYMKERQATVLIVSGTEAASSQLEEYVIQHGLRAVFAKNGTEALTAVQDSAPDLVMLCLDLPDEGSIRLAEHLKATAALSTIPVVALASREQLEQLEYCLTLGVEDYMLLPLHPQIVRSRLNAVNAHAEQTAHVADARREEALLKIERDIQIGRNIQQSFLPQVLPEVPGWELAARFQPAREVAGDFYDAFPLNQGRRLGIVIADVCDKGVGAALFMALFRSLIRAFAQQHYSIRWMGDEETDFLSNPVVDRRRAIPSTGTTALKNAMSLTNNYIITNHGDTSMFATMFFGVLDPATGLLSYVNGGHNPPWIFNNAGIKTRLVPSGPAVGMVPDADYVIQQATFMPGDYLLMFTDGVIEARDSAGAFFTEARLRSCLVDPFPASAQSLLDRIHAELTAHIGMAAQFDDITMLALRRGLPVEKVPVT